MALDGNGKQEHRNGRLHVKADSIILQARYC
jgi:hypothetical protein